MLPKKYRLPLRSELKRLQKEGKLFQGEFFSLLVALQPQKENFKFQNSRFGFIISHKIHKKAVRRNHARRLLVAVLLGFLPQLKSGFDVVFLAKKPLIEANFNQIKKEVSLIFKKAHLL